MSNYQSQSARDAESAGYGDASYWRYLDEHAESLYDAFMRRGDPETARQMFTQSLSEALQGNDGE